MSCDPGPVSRVESRAASLDTLLSSPARQLSQSDAATHSQYRVCIVQPNNGISLLEKPRFSEPICDIFLQKPQNSRVSRYTVNVGGMCEVFLQNLPVLFTFDRCNQSCKISAESAIDIGPGLHQIRIRLPPDSPIRTDFVHQPV